MRTIAAKSEEMKGEMTDLKKYFVVDETTYAGQGIVLYKFDASQSATFIQEMMIPMRDMFASEEKIKREIEMYEKEREEIIREHLPTKELIMSGDFGEALSYYIALEYFAKDANVAPKKLRFKGDPNSPLPKTDILLFEIKDKEHPSPADIMYAIEVKTRKDSPSLVNRESSIMAAVEGAETDKISRAAKTITYLIKRIKDTGEPKELLDGVERFKDAFIKPYDKKYHAIAIVEEKYLPRHIAYISEKLSEAHPDIAVYCLPISELEKMYNAFYTRMPIEA